MFSSATSCLSSVTHSYVSKRGKTRLKKELLTQEKTNRTCSPQGFSTQKKSNIVWGFFRFLSESALVPRLVQVSRRMMKNFGEKDNEKELRETLKINKRTYFIFLFVFAVTNVCLF